MIEMSEFMYDGLNFCELIDGLANITQQIILALYHCNEIVNSNRINIFWGYIKDLSMWCCVTFSLNKHDITTVENH